MGCPDRGAVASSRGRRTRDLHDVLGVVPVEIVWRQRRWVCLDAGCSRRAFSEQVPALDAPRGSITTRAIGWSIGQLRAEHATKRPGMFTGMVDLTRDQHGRAHARLLDLVPGRTGKAYATWLTDRSAAFRGGVEVATLDPFRGYANALRDELSGAVPVLDAFHVVKLAAQAMDETRHRVQQDPLGHRGRARDPLYRVRHAVHRAAGELTERQRTRPADCLERGDPPTESSSPGGATDASGPPTPPSHPPTGTRRGDVRVLPRSPRSPASAARCASGKTPTWATSRPAARATAAPRPSTESSSSTGASPAATATPTATDSACSWPPADCCSHRTCDEPLSPRRGSRVRPRALSSGSDGTVDHLLRRGCVTAPAHEGAKNVLGGNHPGELSARKVRRCDSCELVGGEGMTVGLQVEGVGGILEGIAS